ncbi:MAG: ARMT1-like domain-containing protein [Desulfomonilaceae bacterium]|nr:ARMT1-like domain-containing protein [Desulfomonilaceae bacterium]
MLLQPDCIGCIYKASLSGIRELTTDDGLTKELISEILRIPGITRPAWDLTSPEVFEPALGLISRSFATPDPFRSMKDRQNEKGMQLLPQLRNLVKESDDPLSTAANLAIIGNSLDLMWSGGSVDVEPLVRKELERRPAPKHFRLLEQRLIESRTVLIFADNCGEIVFDKVFLETVRTVCDPEIYYVVRSVPALNDATLEDARLVGLDALAHPIENGIQGPLPGTVLSRCSQDVRDLTEKADLIISKGGGNFDSLEEATHLHDKMLFMLMSKCVPYCRYFGTEMFDPILSPPKRPV